ncbi:helix-turn-helix domain-containing protein [Flammeovirga sp. EKP202]|uniref:helix-turn-helix domain-containing protein n=1 Tax=Flammeovirga sp. EKP202 TaxID=2770592 RepID=UPI00165FE806|nr:helix-turn-helix domain-containing protein [Flammeovirga sp. EKP202]MBD0402745.1 helix-turn-helix domain-containing protein [Flammeovirga sp. EKP202]
MQLTKPQRIELQILLEAKLSKKKIAKVLNVHLSTIYREMKRNSFEGKYNAEKADQLALARKKVVGSLSKTTKKQPLKRKNKYELYADRRFIYWRSDTPRKRKQYLFLQYRYYWKTQRYKIRLGFEKTFHYLNDIPLMELLITHLQKEQQTTHFSKPPTKTLPSILSTLQEHSYNKVA